MSAAAAMADGREDGREPLGEVGMWVFLASEVLFFGALVTGYVVYRNAYAASFSVASHRLDWLLGTVNTGVLLTSSLTMALAVFSARLRRTGAAIAALAGTAALGIVFLLVKGVEYAKEFAERLMPWQAGADFALGSGNAAHNELFFNFYFAMTGLHALHLLVAIAVVLVLVAPVARGTPNAVRSVGVAGLYWHFVDVVWVFLYPLLYLVGR